MQQFVEATIQALQNGTADPQRLSLDLHQLSEQLEAVEGQYETAPEGEEELRQSLLHGVRLYQHSLDLLGRYLQHPDPDLLTRAGQAVQEASQQLADLAADTSDL